MLDPRIIKEKSQVIRDMLKARSMEFDLQALIDSDQMRREFIMKTDELRKKKNQMALEISQRKKTGEDVPATIEEMKKISSFKNTR